MLLPPREVVKMAGEHGPGLAPKTIIGLARRSDVIFTDNVSMVRAAGPVLRFAHIDGLTVTGNEQPLDSGALASITDCTDITTE